MRTASLFATVAVSALLLSTGPVFTQSADLGVIEFPNSGSTAAQPAFQRGVKQLHNFQFDDAAEAFQEAQKIDPTFALAYWGEAMSYNHPLWAEVDLEAARKTLARLAPTAEARLAAARMPVEKGLLSAVEVLFGEGDKLARDMAYAQAMERLHEQHPDDDEVAVFYALSLLGTVRPGDQGFRRQMLAGGIVQEVFRKNSQHPGAAHFVIHSLDDPVHAPLALHAAREYAKIAPAAHHALHMPSHIFVQRGMWEQVAASNTAAYEASVAWAARRGFSPGRRDFHSLSWLHYAQLQMGQYARAKQTIDIARKVADELNDPRSRVRNVMSTMVARQMVESGQWQKIPMQGESSGHAHDASGAHMNHLYDANAAVLVAAGFGAARLKDVAAAEEALSRLGALVAQHEKAGDGYAAKVAKILVDEVGAVLRAEQGRTDDALALARAAASLELTLDPPSGLPEPIKPATELYGELLLGAGRASDAAAQFEKTLERMPRRAPALLGSARSHAEAGDRATARRRYAELTAIWANADAGVAGLDEARRFVSASND